MFGSFVSNGHTLRDATGKARGGRSMEEEYVASTPKLFNPCTTLPHLHPPPYKGEGFIRTFLPIPKSLTPMDNPGVLFKV